MGLALGLAITALLAATVTPVPLPPVGNGGALPMPLAIGPGLPEAAHGGAPAGCPNDANGSIGCYVLAVLGPGNVQLAAIDNVSLQYPTGVHYRLPTVLVAACNDSARVGANGSVVPYAVTCADPMAILPVTGGWGPCSPTRCGGSAPSGPVPAFLVEHEGFAVEIGPMGDPTGVEIVFEGASLGTVSVPLS